MFIYFIVCYHISLFQVLFLVTYFFYATCYVMVLRTYLCYCCYSWRWLSSWNM